jgi:hypothetical protein
VSSVDRRSLRNRLWGDGFLLCSRRERNNRLGLRLGDRVFWDVVELGSNSRFGSSLLLFLLGVSLFLVFIPVVIATRFFLEVAEDVVQDEVSVGLFSEEKGLGKLAPGLASVGYLADNLDNNTRGGR